MGKLEPLIQKSFERLSLKDFKFNHVLLGTIPPRIGGIKCYTFTSRDEVILDLEVADIISNHKSVLLAISHSSRG